MYIICMYVYRQELKAHDFLDVSISFKTRMHNHWLKRTVQNQYVSDS